jgi:transposase
MRDDDGRKLDHKTLEQLRLRAVRRIEQGAHPEDVAAGLGMTRAAVYGWLAKYREGGVEALRARPVPGRPPTLSGAQLQRVSPLVVGNDPRQLQFTFALWTRAMVRELIGREFAVRLSEVSVGRLLRKLGLSPQRPLSRADQQNPEAVAVEGRDLPGNPCRGRSGGGHGLPHRRGRGALRRPRRHHLGAGRPDPRGGHDRRPVRDQPHLRGRRQGGAAVRRR